MIKAGRLYEFIGKVISIRNEEQEERVMWEFWLHKDFDRSYSDFLAETGGKQSDQGTASKRELAEIVKQSMEIASFVPQEE